MKGDSWAIGFEGKEEKLYKSDIGFYYLKILLEHSGTSFSAAELDCIVRRKTKDEYCASVSAVEDMTEGGTTILGQTDAGPILDAEAVRSFQLRLEEIEKNLEEARTNNDLAKIEELERENEWISSELTKAGGLGGRLRKLADERNKVRMRVGNAIRRAQKKIEQYDKPLSKHLKKPVLNLGQTLSYIPRDGLTWSTLPTSTG